MRSACIVAAVCSKQIGCAYAAKLGQNYLEVWVFGVCHFLPAGRRHDITLLVSRQKPVGYGLNLIGVEASHSM